MVGGGKTPDSPLSAAAGAAGREATEAFALLADETRLAILLALWDAHDPHAEADAVSFTALRDRVGIQQGGQFNYHLDKLVGRFVRKTDGGYALRQPGLVLVQSIIAGTGFHDSTLEPTPVDATCGRCGGQSAVTYENHRVYRVCTECEGFASPDDVHPTGALEGWTFEPTGLADRRAEAVFAASTLKTYSRIALRFENVCPECSARVEWSLDVCAAHDADEGEHCAECGRDDPVLARETCTVCKSSGWGSPGIKVLFHPAVVSFLYDHGVAVGFTGDTEFADVVRTLELVEEFEETVVSTDPARVRVTVARDGDRLHLDLDDGMNVVGVSEESG